MGSWLMRGRLECKLHGVRTCNICLHCITEAADGSIPDPIDAPRIPYPESKHSIKPRFEFLGDVPMATLSNEQTNPDELREFGGPSLAYLCKWTAIHSSLGPPNNVFSQFGEGRMLRILYLRHNDYLYTNSEYFAARAWRFHLIVVTSLNPAVLSLLLRAHKLKYSSRRKAFVERNVLGMVTSKIPTTEERWYQMVSFVQKVKDLAALGIQVYWDTMEPDKCYEAARAKFLDQPPQLPAPQREDLEDDADFEEEDLVVDNSFEYLPSHEGFEAVESEDPEGSPEMLATLFPKSSRGGFPYLQ